MDYTGVLGFIAVDYRYNVTLEFWDQADYVRYLSDHSDRVESEEIRSDGYAEATLSE